MSIKHMMRNSKTALIQKNVLLLPIGINYHQKEKCLTSREVYWKQQGEKVEYPNFLNNNRVKYHNVLLICTQRNI